MSNIIHVPYPGETSCQGLCGLKIYNPDIPFGRNIGSFYPGKMLFINGTPNPDCPRFSINLKSGKENAFHFDVRFNFDNDSNVIIRNAKIDGKFGEAEKTLSCPFPFAPGKAFELVLLVDQSGYKVAVNNQHILEFSHRFPMENVNLLRVRGDVKISLIRIQG
ncbi:galectin-5-like [Ruditapes philippinarum]|uniref:galectin-5-like n=1 Tax=Ruditapes philippinarum TaxID=129788 RepID=UPI00295B721D|nr:galectin-5-like [Ruditapes philippinarum]